MWSTLGVLSLLIALGQALQRLDPRKAQGGEAEPVKNTPLRWKAPNNVPARGQLRPDPFALNVEDKWRSSHSRSWSCSCSYTPSCSSYSSSSSSCSSTSTKECPSADEVNVPAFIQAGRAVRGIPDLLRTPERPDERTRRHHRKPREPCCSSSSSSSTCSSSSSSISCSSSSSSFKCPCGVCTEEIGRLRPGPALICRQCPPESDCGCGCQRVNPCRCHQQPQPCGCNNGCQCGCQQGRPCRCGGQQGQCLCGCSCGPNCNCGCRRGKPCTCGGGCAPPQPCQCCSPCEPCSSSSSSSSCPSSGTTHCKCISQLIKEWDFRRQAPTFGIRAGDWEYWQLEDTVANGGTFRTSCRRGLLLESQPYTVTADQGFYYWQDHYKWFAFPKAAARMPCRGQLIFQYDDVAVQTDGRGCGVFPFPHSVVRSYDDVRLASGSFRVFDEASGMNFAFHLTNDQVYVLYERLVPPNIPAIQDNKIGQGSVALGFRPSPPHGFTNIIPVGSRQPDQVHTLQLIFDVDCRTVSWVLDGTSVLTVKRIGYPLGRDSMVKDVGGLDIGAFPTMLYYGFGSMTLLDYYPVCQGACPKNITAGVPVDSNARCNYPKRHIALVQTAITEAFNPVCGPPKPARYFDAYSVPSNRLWGQGSWTQIGGIQVTNQYCLEYRN